MKALNRDIVEQSKTGDRASQMIEACPGDEPWTACAEEECPNRHDETGERRRTKIGNEQEEKRFRTGGELNDRRTNGGAFSSERPLLWLRIRSLRKEESAVGSMLVFVSGVEQVAENAASGKKTESRSGNSRTRTKSPTAL